MAKHTDNQDFYDFEKPDKKSFKKGKTIKLKLNVKGHKIQLESDENGWTGHFVGQPTNLFFNDSKQALIDEMMNEAQL